MPLRSAASGGLASAQQGFQHAAAVGSSRGRITGPLGVGHQAQNAAAGIGDACDVGHRPVGVVAVAQGDGVVVLQLFERVIAALV